MDSVADLAFHFDAGPDPTFHSDADPDPAFHFDAPNFPSAAYPDPTFQIYPDPDPTTLFSPEILDPPMLKNDPLELLSFHFDADPDLEPDPAFHFDAAHIRM